MKKILPFIILLFVGQACDICDCPDPEPIPDCNLAYAGFWTAESNCTGDKLPYTMTFNESENCDSASIYNFLDDGETITVEFNQMSLSIPNQQLDERYDIYGSGFMIGDTLKLTFSKVDVVFGGSEIQCELKATKQK